MPSVSGAPWAASEFSYAGWVPNVRTHLSFSLIGRAPGATALSAAFQTRASRLVIVLQQRLSNDYPNFDRWIQRKRPDLKHHWLVEAVTREAEVPKLENGRLATEQDGIKTEPDRQGMLLGTVHIFPYQEEREWAVYQNDALSAVLAEISGQTSIASMEEPVEVDAKLDALHERVLAHIKDVLNRVAIRFALLRTGELRLWYDVVPDLSSAELRTLAEQAYFFVKDVVHSHTHHDPSSDQITPLTPIRQAGSEPLHNGDIAWRRETLWSLSREIELLSNRGLLNQRRSLGFIAYAEAFQHYLMGYVRREDDPSKFRPAPQVHNYNFAHLKDSIRVEVDVRAAARALAIQVVIGLNAALLAAASLSTALVSSHNTYAKSAGNGDYTGIYIPSLFRSLLATPLLAGVVAATTLMTLLTYIFVDGEIGLYNPPQRILTQLSRAKAISDAADDADQLKRDTQMLLGIMFVCSAFVLGPWFLVAYLLY